MKKRGKVIVGSIAAASILCSNQSVSADVDLSPEHWAPELRKQAEQKEERAWTAENGREISGKNALISTTCSAIALRAGMTALEQGGTAADAAATVALTQVCTQLGSVVSYAGILSFLYYDAGTKKVVSMDAGYNSCINENDPSSIPSSDLGTLKIYNTAELSKEPKHGRKVLVPGFMAGIETLQKRFGRLPFESLFQPAIWYAEHGVRIGDILSNYFEMRRHFLERTAEGRSFLKQAGGESPKKGELFRQIELAKTLRAISKQGSKYMYSGPWAEHFVEVVKREGGKIELKDLANYEPVWTEPVISTYLDRRIYYPGKPNECATQIIPALNFAEQLKFDKRADYWNDPLVLRDYQRIFDLTDLAPWLDSSVSKVLQSKNIDCSASAQLDKAYAESVTGLLDQISFKKSRKPEHSDSIVVVDKDGNIAAITHSINTVVWGDTGIIVDGIPIPDSANFQQQRLAGIKPGARLPHEMPQVFVFENGKPVMATAAIGSSMIQETVKTIVGLVGKGESLESVMQKPPLIYNFKDLGRTATVAERGVVIPASSYSDDFVNKLKENVEKVIVLSQAEIAGLRGTVSTITINNNTGEKRSAESTGSLVLGEAN